MRDYPHNESEASFSSIDDLWYKDDEVSWYLTDSGEVDCTVHFESNLVQPEDEEQHMLEKDCYEFDSKFYREESNKMEAENEYNTQYEENSKEIA